MEKRDQLTRTCTVCGLQKPLSAFLQITAKGTTYGAICASCRNKSAKSNIKTLDDERSSTTNAGARIGAKERTEIEREKQRLKKETKDSNLKEARQNELLETDKLDRADKLEKAEKSHRGEIEEKKKRGFLNYQSIKQPASTQSLIGQKIEDRTFAAKAHFNERQQTIEAKKVEDAIKQELRINSVDLSGTPHHSMTSANNPTFRAFLTWLGSSAPIVRAMDQMFSKSAPLAEKAAMQKSVNTLASQQTTFAKSVANEKAAKTTREVAGQKPDVIKEFINKSWRR